MSYFIAMQDESSFRGMVIGSLNLDDGLMTHRCAMNQAIDGILAG
jgi:hypothetical protein